MKDGYVHNLLTVMGLVWGIRQILRVHHGGLCFFALPCQSFGFMSCPLHARSSEDPWGSRKWSFVLQGNLLAARTSLLWLLGAARSCAVLLENPHRSKIIEIPFIKHIMSFPELMNNQIKWSGPFVFGSCPFPRYMGHYGHWCEKPEIGIGNAHFVSLCVRSVLEAMGSPALSADAPGPSFADSVSR